MNTAVDLVTLLHDTVNLLVLAVKLLACSHGQVLQPASDGADLVEIVLNLTLLLFVTVISLKLILGALRHAALAAAIRRRLRLGEGFLDMRLRIVPKLARSVPGGLLHVVPFEDSSLTLLVALGRIERIFDVHGKHAPVEGLELACSLFGCPVCTLGEIKVLFSIEDTVSLGTQASERVSSGLFGGSGSTKGVSCRGDGFLLDEPVAC